MRIPSSPLNPLFTARNLGALLACVLIFFSALCIWTAPYGTFHVFSLLRAGKYARIKQLFRYRAPRDREEKYALARAYSWSFEKKYLKPTPGKRTKKSRFSRSSQRRNRARLEQARQRRLLQRSWRRNERFPRELSLAFQYYLAVRNTSCPRTDSRNALLQCLSRENRNRTADHLDRLATYRAGLLARRLGMGVLRLKILDGVDVSRTSPLSRFIYAARIAERIRLNLPEEAYTIAFTQGSALDDARVSFWRARAALGKRKRAAALRLYMRSLELHPTRGLRRDILKDLRRSYNYLFRPNALRKRTRFNRALVLLSDLMTRNEISSLKRAFSTRDFIRTARKETLEYDGLFLIRGGASGALPRLAQRFSDSLGKRPWILRLWTARLLQKREFGTFQRLMKDFPNARRNDRGLWRSYLTYIETRGSRRAYFAEILSYLKSHHSDYGAHDRLIRELIGGHVKKRRWAPRELWEQARRELGNRTMNGRFLFWYKNYLLAMGRIREARSVAENFYERAPGTYYAHTFWKAQSGDYRGDWAQVRDRSSYLRWVSKHGGNEKALRFLSRVDYTRYADPRAVELWREVRAGAKNVSRPILDLYRMGEYALGNAYYREAFPGSSGPEDLLLRARIGLASENLFLSVYYLRQTARARGIPEDPFSLPGPMLRNLYPRPYLALVQKYAARHNVGQEKIYAIMRQESMYRETATSRSNARGLMQIMPRTGAWLARRMGLKTYNLYNPETSIRLGSKFFSDLLRSYQTDFRWASLAYNGGPGNLRRWKRRYYQGDLNRFLEFVPSRESRNYCRITYQNYLHYRVANLLLN